MVGRTDGRTDHLLELRGYIKYSELFFEISQKQEWNAAAAMAASVSIRICIDRVHGAAVGELNGDC